MKKNHQKRERVYEIHKQIKRKNKFYIKTQLVAPTQKQNATNKISSQSVAISNGWKSTKLEKMQ